MESIHGVIRATRDDICVSLKNNAGGPKPAGVKFHDLPMTLLARSPGIEQSREVR